MATSKMTSKGQVTVPKEVRERLGLRPGDELEFVEEDGIYRVRRCISPSPFKKYRGYLAHLANKSSDELVEEMRGN